jgi:hypothetical protein
MHPYKLAVINGKIVANFENVKSDEIKTSRQKRKIGIKRKSKSEKDFEMFLYAIDLNWQRYGNGYYPDSYGTIHTGELNE